MSALRLPGLLPGDPSRLIPVDDGCTPRPIGPYYLQGGSAVVGGSVTASAKKPLTPEQRANANARMRKYHHADPQRALDRQRRYRRKGVQV